MTQAPAQGVASALQHGRGDLTDQEGPGPARLIQITDSHLFADPGGRLLGLKTRSSFEAVLRLALGAQRPAQALVMTGDLIHDESAEGYGYLRGVLEATGLPCYCIPGNHDRPELIAQWLGPAALGRVASRALGPWTLIFLDSTHAGHEGGRLATDQLEAMDALLAANPSPALIFLHQHPVPVGSAWMDTMGVENGQDLMAICDRHPQIRALVFGHVHQEFSVERGGYRILGTPSTCVQFLPGRAEFTIDTRAPGYRELLLYPDGRLETWVKRLETYPEPLDTESHGY